MDTFCKIPDAVGITGPCFLDDRLLVASQTGDVWEIAPNGEAAPFASTSGMPLGLAVDGAGNVFAADVAHAAMLTVASDRVQKLVDKYEGEQLVGPSACALDAAGNLYVILCAAEHFPAACRISCCCSILMVVRVLLCRYFTDAGPLGESSLAAPKGSVFMVEARQNLLKPLALRCLAHPAAVACNDATGALFVAEQMANRVLRLVQKPSGVYHAAVYHQFSGRFGPSALAVDPRTGVLYVGRYELRNHSSGGGVVSVVHPERGHVHDIAVPGPEVSGLCLSADGAELYVTEESTCSVYVCAVPDLDDGGR